MFLVLFFFFFKQKTAYEMRISDWSSDVCSSDLYLRVNSAVIAQTANILMYLSERHGFDPWRMRTRYWLNQVQLTIADMVEEAHDVHHPVSTALFYEDQKEAAKQAAAHFRDMRIPKYMAYFERDLAADEGDWLAEGRWTYADLSLFQLVVGLRYAFPNSLGRMTRI